MKSASLKNTPGAPLHVTLRWDTGDIQPVGRLAWRDRVAYLEYDEAFLASKLEISPVHHRIESGVIRPHDVAVFEGLHGVFNDSLPDGWGRLLVDRRARQLGIESATLTPLDRLACVGDQAIGALCYAPAIDVWDETAPTLDLDKLAADAHRVLEGAAGDVISELGQAGGSPGGARPKALIAINEHGHAVHGADDTPDGYTPYLVKFRGADDPEDAAQIEQAYAQMAKAAGVRMPETRLIASAAKQPYFAARRFDREGPKRLHVHSASGLLYADIRLPSLDYKDLIALTRFLTRDRREGAAMFTLAVFNVLSHNRDDHARQFSFIMERDGAWRLAPAYDLTFAPGPGGEHSTSVLGHGKAITRQHLIELGKKADLKTKEIDDITDAVTEAVTNWPRFAEACGVKHASCKRIAAVLENTLKEGDVRMGATAAIRKGLTQVRKERGKDTAEVFDRLHTKSGTNDT
ncbi:MAG: type II toxin-antitoxin system HipA family toxin [Rhodospirillales bacterium]|nr:type II toxin-antitoxin system HipA family toxin [Rhodospirillales bacterium]